MRPLRLAPCSRLTPCRTASGRGLNDRCATGVLDVLRNAGIDVPGDMSVVGFDDSRLARLSHIALTTVAQDTHQLTSLAIARAAARLDGSAIAERELVIPPHLIIRSTTAAPAR